LDPAKATTPTHAYATPAGSACWVARAVDPNIGPVAEVLHVDGVFSEPLFCVIEGWSQQSGVAVLHVRDVTDGRRLALFHNLDDEDSVSEDTLTVGEIVELRHLAEETA
jgi:hypothetical protein